jgi:alginate O-acetyltransferase complex protein AlgI
VLFNSFHFIVFFLFGTLFFSLLNNKFKWPFLLGLSLFFYGYWQWSYLVLIGLSIIIDYFCAQMIVKRPERKKVFLVFSILSNLSILGVFKYAFFVTSTFSSLGSFLGLSFDPFTMKLLLPLGISFYTFQSMSYTIDVYRGQILPEKSFFKFALFISFFPQLVAGPIERAKNILPQFCSANKITAEDLVKGLRLILLGYFLKVGVADNLAKYVDVIFSNTLVLDTFSALLGTYFFGLQIYCDFWGYSSLARGCAKFFGIDLMKNFDHPYRSLNISEFWRRWHISLSSWFKDYVFIPLGGSQHKLLRNLFLVFALSGLWHGASWTFIIWGIINGLGVIVHKLYQAHLRKSIQSKMSNGLYSTLCWFLTFHYVMFSWVWFRSSNISLAITYFERMVSLTYRTLDAYQLPDIRTGVLAIILLIILEVFMIKKRAIGIFPKFFRWGLYYACLFFLMFYGQLSSEKQFIYFQF